jgi:hypothetical protein
MIHRNAVSVEQQDSIQDLEYRFRSGGIVYAILIDEPMVLSQSLSRVLVSCDIIWQKPNITQLVIN